MAGTKYPDPDTIVCIIRDRNDFSILKDQLWYRIPVDSAPESLQNAQFLAFYQTAVFGNLKWAIRYYGSIKNIRIVRRKNLFPFEPLNEKSNKRYYKVKLNNLLQFRKLIPSTKGRRLIFIPTTFYKLTHAEEINDLFHGSPLEDRLWNVFKMENVEAERQFIVCEKKTFYFLDFAVFCNERNLNVECDSRKYHGGAEAILRDEERDQVLSRRGWFIVRFTSPDIKNPTQCIARVKNLIKQNGGLTARGNIKRWIQTEHQSGYHQLDLF